VRLPTELFVGPCVLLAILDAIGAAWRGTGLEVIGEE
jgi:hypothetical protein